MVTVEKDLLLACSYFDLGHCGYFETKDLVCIRKKSFIICLQFDPSNFLSIMLSFDSFRRKSWSRWISICLELKSRNLFRKWRPVRERINRLVVLLENHPHHPKLFLSKFKLPNLISVVSQDIESKRGGLENPIIWDPNRCPVRSV